MPHFTTRNLNQYAVLYAALNTGNPSDLDDSGTRKVSAAVQIPVRWEDDRKELEDAHGNSIIVDAVVTVDRSITQDSLMWKGQKADLPSPVTDLYVVTAYVEVPTIKRSKFYREVGLVRYTDTLPTIA